MTRKSIEEEIKASYLDYAMSVIVQRALPDVRDGLKPVHRRILHAMAEMSVAHDKPYKKSARIVGETMGKYHPHGDTAIYDAMARMAQDFSLRYTLIDGQGNFGSIDGDEPAAMRYTEVRMSRMAEDLFQDIDKKTVPFRLNFDGSLEEPDYLPAKVPQLLINGSSGIAVGMATNMLPHNLREVVDAISYRVKNPECMIEDLLKFIKGPDFPTGAELFHSRHLLDSYLTGRGKVTIRGQADMSEHKRIIITSIPYGVNKSTMIEKIAENVKNEVITGIAEIRDESGREGIRIVIRVKDEELKPLVLRQLYAHSELETSIGIINLVLKDNQPMVMNLTGLIDSFIEHRLSVILKRSQFDLDRNREREHILAGLEKAISMLDETISIIRKAKDPQAAKLNLQEKLEISEKQASAILDLRLQRLTALETDKIRGELADVRKEIENLLKIIASEDIRKQILLDEMVEIRKRYGDDRRTSISYSEAQDVDESDLIPREQNVVILSQSGFIKRVSLDEYRSQRRGGKGVLTTGWRDDAPRSIVSCSSHDLLLFFTNTGRVLKKFAYGIERKGRTGAGIIGAALLPLQEGETVRNLIPGDNLDSGFLLITTRNALVKKVDVSQLQKMRDSGARIITLRDDDEVVSVDFLPEDSLLFNLTSAGKALVYSSSEIRPSGRTSMGVRSIRLKQGAILQNAFPVKKDDTVLTVTSAGLGKRTSVENFTAHHRGSGGMYAIKPTRRSGKVVTALRVSDEDEIIILTRNDKTIRIKVDGVREMSRSATGVRLIDLDEDDEVIAAAKI